MSRLYPLTRGTKVSRAIYAANGAPVCVIDSMGELAAWEEHEVAARIVAAVNALSADPVDPSDLRLELAQTRDDLLVALRTARAALEGYASACRYLAEMEADSGGVVWTLRRPQVEASLAELDLAIQAAQQP